MELQKRLTETRAAWLVCAVLFAGTLALYWPSFGFEFLSYDDSDYVFGNAVVRAGLTWPGITWAFTTSYTGNWLPLTWLSHMLVCQFFGMAPGAHHLVNVVLHAASAVLLFVVLRRMTGALWRSAIVAALFAWHPLHVESVAWVSERKDVLSGLFFMLTLWAWAGYVDKTESRKQKAEQRPPTTDHRLLTTDHATRITQHASRITDHSSRSRARRFYVLSLTFFALGLMSKSMLVTLPFVLLLLDFWPLKRSAECGVRNAEPQGNAECGVRNAESPKRSRGTPHSALRIPHFFSLPQSALLEKLPFFVLSAAVSAVTYVVQKQAGSMLPLEAVSFGGRCANAVVSCVRYLAKTVYPEGLTVLYPFPKHLPAWEVAGAAAILVVATTAAIVLARRRPWLAVGWFWYLGMLVPVIGIVQVGRQAMADRYTYLPLIGIFIAVVWGMAEVVRVACCVLRGSTRHAPRTTHHAPRITALVAALVVLVASALLTRHQLQYWRNSELLWKRALAVTDGNAGAHHNYGFALEQRGELEQAMAQYRGALQIEPNLFEANDNLGRLLCQLGRPREATNYLVQAVRIFPGAAVARAHLGRALLALGDWDGARTNYEAAMAAAPGNAAIPVDWGKALLTQKRPEAALEKFAQALKLDPGSSDARLGYAQAAAGCGAVLAAEGKLREAVGRYREALRLEPDLPEVLNNLAWVLATAKDDTLRDGAAAVALAQRACELTAYKQPMFIGTLAAAYAEAGQFAEACETAQKAIALAEAAGQAELAARNRELLKGYEAGKAYRDH